MHRTSTSRPRLAAALVAAAVAAATLAGTAGTVAGAAPSRESSAPSQGAPSQVLAERMHGEAAIRALGDRLPEVADRNGLVAAELTRRLRADDALWVDEHGRLLFVDEVAGHAEAAAAATTDPSWVEQPTSAAFTLHSRPGADRVIHLDFDGHDPSTSGWSNKTYAQPYDTDGNPSTFSDAERRTAIEVWQRVAEDFAPFAIDVTTQDPGIDAIRRTTVDDVRFGTRVVVTPTRSNCTSCGGVAYLRTFDVYGGSASTGWTHDRYQPAWVYPDGWTAKSIAEAASHEAGHNLGLEHDGTATEGYYRGHGDWAPIMGVGYYKGVTQWSKGEYSGANNPQDDLAVVVQHGGPLAGDDHGDTVAAGTALPTVVDVIGEIGTGADVDAFSFTTAGGAVGLTAAPISVGANLDLSLRLVHQDGTVITTVDGDGLGATLDVTLPGGTYAVVVDGVGAGDPRTSGYSDYASLGRYRITGTLPSSTPVAENRAPTAAIAASTTSGEAPLAVSFSAAGSSDPDGDQLTYAWDLGGGRTATTPTASATYEAGTHKVTLTVSDGQLTSTATATVTATQGTVTAPTEPVLTATSSSGAVSLDWDDAMATGTYSVYRETYHAKTRTYRSRTLIATLSAPMTTHVDRPGTGTFRYQVVAANAAGSATSAHVVATVTSTTRKTTGKSGSNASTAR